jgi:hypothetical protein
MASAVREAIRALARMESKNVRDQHLEAGDRTVVPVFGALCRTKVAQGPGDWVAGFNAGLRGDAYIYPAGVKSRVPWSAGFIEGAAQRLHRHAHIRITARLALRLWWQP